MLEARILIVDDDRVQAEALRRVLSLEGFHATAKYTPGDALDEVGIRMPDAIISDYRMDGMTGLDLYRCVRALDEEVLFILATGFGSVDTAVEALKAGVYDFITKPIDTAELVIKLKKALDYRSLASENADLKRRLERLGEKPRIIAESPLMLRVLDNVERIAASTATVLIQGESGTGKELIARSLHFDSPRAEGPYIKVNCAAIPENLLEDELFGHEAGAFTGAVGPRIGKFEAADGGSIFLDEIAEMPSHLQTKFLRVLQEREFERVGGNDTHRVEVRVIAATNRDLATMVKEGEFREDLFYRLNVVPIHIPPLRERRADIIVLAEHFLQRFCDQNGRQMRPFSPAVRELLQSHSWPGNVRELENCLERAVVLARSDELLPEDVVFEREGSRDGLGTVLEDLLGTELTIDQVERRLVLSALDRCSGNVSQTARRLGMTRRALQYRLDKYRAKESGPTDSELADA